MVSTDESTMIEFEVYGEQRPQGSKIAQVIYRNGKPLTKDGRVITVARDDNKHLKSWRQEVAAAAVAVKPDELLLGPVQLEITFYRPRPKGHFGTGRNAERLKDSAPRLPTPKPDTVKLTRAVEDALTGIIWRDDSQVCRHVLEKRYGRCHCTVVRIREI